MRQRKLFPINMLLTKININQKQTRKDMTQWNYKLIGDFNMNYKKINTNIDNLNSQIKLNNNRIQIEINNIKSALYIYYVIFIIFLCLIYSKK